MTVSYDVVNGWTVVEVDGDVDIYTSPMIREAVPPSPSGTAIHP